jgi:hypothetical protein
MITNAWEWIRRLDEPLTGDLCSDLCKACASYAEENPRSVFAFALWKACNDLDSLFGEDQGIPHEQFQTIQKTIQNPLRRIIQGGLREGLSGQWDALADLIEGLSTLRKTI